MNFTHQFYKSHTVLFLGDSHSSIIPRINNRIVGGIETDISEHPYQLSLEYLGKHFCGAALISPEWAITAAHCVDGLFINFLTVRAGSTESNKGGKVEQVKKSYKHNSYNKKSIDYDIALLKLDEPIPDWYARPIMLPKEGLILREGVVANVTGWGSTSENGELAVKLRVAEIPIIALSKCRKAYGYNSITNRMFCAGLSDGGKDSCQGDSGGPLVFNDILYGVVSWGYGCARAGRPGVYTNVSVLRNFITQVTGI